jgi:hypothetical protein
MWLPNGDVKMIRGEPEEILKKLRQLVTVFCMVDLPLEPATRGITRKLVPGLPTKQEERPSIAGKPTY